MTNDEFKESVTQARQHLEHAASMLDPDMSLEELEAVALCVEGIGVTLDMIRKRRLATVISK